MKMLFFCIYSPFFSLFNFIFFKKINMSRDTCQNKGYLVSVFSYYRMDLKINHNDTYHLIKVNHNELISILDLLYVLKNTRKNWERKENLEEKRVGKKKKKCKNLYLNSSYQTLYQLQQKSNINNQLMIVIVIIIDEW